MTINNSPVRLEIESNIAFIVIDNPPVNAMSQAVRAGLLREVNVLANDGAVDAVVIICAGRTFIAGADIKEFGKPSADPQLPDVIDCLENLGKPVIAAIHGTALGGGFEIALGAHYRIASPGSKVGTPEVNLGIIPGAGGCYRLPRLVGVEAALEMIAGGAPIPVEAAMHLGAIDAIVKGDLRDAALLYAKQIIDAGSITRRTTDENMQQPSPSLFDDARAKYEKTKRGQNAPQRAIDAVEEAAALPVDEAARRCREIFLELRSSRQAEALRHVFFAEREISLIPDLSSEAKGKTVEAAAVIGAGAMGGGIAMCFANAGIAVTLVDISDENIERGLSGIRKNYDSAISKGKMNESKAAECMARIDGATDYGRIEKVDLVVEAVFEDLELKKKVFKALDEACMPETILATNTSYLSINEIADATERPDKVLGLHFFNPAHIMKLLEIVRTPQTSDDTLSTALDLAKSLRKTGVVSGVCFGFIGNRMLNAYRTEALRLALEGAKIADIDRALFEFGMPMGPFALMDLTGLEVNVKMRQQADPESIEQSAFMVVDRLYEAGRLGQRSGAGFYCYEDGSRTPQVDPDVDQWIADAAAMQGIKRRTDLTFAEITDRCMLTLANEGARILEEGVAIRSGDIDVAYVAGYGFPRHLGGPMCWAAQEGFAAITRRLNHYHEHYGLARWRAATVIERAATANMNLDEALAHRRNI